MVNLNEREWAVLREMARSFVRNCEKSAWIEDVWVVGDTLVGEEVELLKKIAK